MITFRLEYCWYPECGILDKITLQKTLVTAVAEGTYHIPGRPLGQTPIFPKASGILPIWRQLSRLLSPPMHDPVINTIRYVKQQATHQSCLVEHQSVIKRVRSVHPPIDISLNPAYCELSRGLDVSMSSYAQLSNLFLDGHARK